MEGKHLCYNGKKETLLLRRIMFIVMLMSLLLLIFFFNSKMVTEIQIVTIIGVCSLLTIASCENTIFTDMLNRELWWDW